MTREPLTVSDAVRALNPGVFQPKPVDGVVRLTIYTEPTPKGRPRITVVNGHGRAYTPAATRNAEAMIRYAVTEQCRTPPFAAGVPLKLTVWFYRTRPPSLPKRVTMPVAKPDLDNYIKCLDALNGCLVVDDNAICDIEAHKRFGSPPRIEMELAQVDA